MAIKIAVKTQALRHLSGDEDIFKNKNRRQKTMRSLLFEKGKYCISDSSRV